MTQLEKILAMQDSNLKLLKLLNYGMRLGIFNKEVVKKEMFRLYDLGYRPCV